MCQHLTPIDASVHPASSAQTANSSGIHARLRLASMEALAFVILAHRALLLADVMLVTLVNTVRVV